MAHMTNRNQLYKVGEPSTDGCLLSEGHHFCDEKQ